MHAELRPWSPRDADDLRAAVRSSPDLALQLGHALLGTREEAVALIEAHLLPTSSRRHLALVVDGVAVGNVGLSALDTVHQTAWTSYWLARSHRGRGLAARGLAALAAWAFAELEVFRLELGHRVNNPASCRVATRAGFPAEGVERAKLRYGDERFDVETHARLASDPCPDLEPLPVRA